MLTAGEEDCVTFWNSEGEWNDWDCSDRLGFVCERRTVSYANAMDSDSINTPTLNFGDFMYHDYYSEEQVLKFQAALISAYTSAYAAVEEAR